jgi:uncharacterized protein (TIGR04255 family)
MAIPLIDVDLTLRFGAVDLNVDRLQYFHKLVSEYYPVLKEELQGIISFASVDHRELAKLHSDELLLSSSRGLSYAGLRPQWEFVLNSFLDVFGVKEINLLSLAYYNEIPLEELRSFQKHLNISFDMPSSLKERIEFFRSEFTYRYDFGEIHVWLQPDYDERSQAYCIQLSMESRNASQMPSKECQTSVQRLHEGIKDVFHQILSEDYIRQLQQ